MSILGFEDLWTAGGVLLGFGLGSLYWRIDMEKDCRRKGLKTWLTLGDYLNLTSVLTITFGVYILPILGFVSVPLVVVLLGLAVILFVGHLFALAAHYKLFRAQIVEEIPRYPLQEIVVFALTALLAVTFIWGASSRGATTQMLTGSTSPPKTTPAAQSVLP